MKSATCAELWAGAALAKLLDRRAVGELERGETGAALADLDRAVQANPRDGVAHYNRACALALSERFDDALLALGRAVDLDPARFRLEALQDPDLAGLHGRVEFRLMIEPGPEPRR